MKQPTNKRNIHWLARCRIDSCDEERVKCPVCKKYGHVTTHILTKIFGRVRISIQHAHFVEEQDGGRNIYCETDIYEDVGYSERVQNWRLTKEGEKRLRSKYSKMWAK